MRIDEWDYCLRRIYSDTPASISIVKGEWKTGKTNAAIHILVEELKNRLGIIKRVAGNVQCFEDADCIIPSNKDIEYVDNFDMMKIFLQQGGKKGFIYDEALKNSPSKKAMTSLNAEWSRIVPELSKGGDVNNPGGCHLFVITQEESMTEKLFQHPTFKTAIWTKLNTKKTDPQHLKVITLKSKHLNHQMRFQNLPATKVNYNPYLGANWSMSPTGISLANLSIDFKVATAYAEGKSTNQILTDFKDDLTDRKDVTRKLRKVLKLVLKNYMTQNAAANINQEILNTPEA